MLIILTGVAAIAGLTSLGCWVYTIVRAFQEGSTVEGILCICGLIGFILGWINASKWEHTQVMTVWTIAILVGIAANVGVAVLQPAAGL